jgi:hypothetical protein
MMIALVLAVWQLTPLVTGSAVDIYEGGWEVRTSIDTVHINGVAYTEDKKPLQMIKPWGDQYLEFDVDNSLWGVPNIIVDIGAPREYIIDRYGEWVQAPTGVHFDSIQKAIGDTMYFWDHYVHRYRVQVTAYPDYQLGGFLDETEGEAVGLADDKQAIINVRTTFTLDPFVNRIIDGFETEGANYTLDTEKVFAGVMSVKVADKEAGFVGYAEGVEPADHLGKTIIAPNGGTLNSYATFDPDDPATSMNIATVVDIDVGGTLAPACKWSDGFFGIGATLTTYAVMFEYIIEVHSIASAGYDLESGNMDDEVIDVDYDQEETVTDIISNTIRSIGDTVDGVFEWLGEGLTEFFNGIGLGFLMPLLSLLIVAAIGYLIIRRLLFKKATQKIMGGQGVIYV